MRINAPVRRFLLAAVICGQLALILTALSTEARAVQQSQLLVESVDIQGNRRNRDEDLLYYIQTRQGDVYDAAQAARDLQSGMGHAKSFTPQPQRDDRH